MVGEGAALETGKLMGEEREMEAVAGGRWREVARTSEEMVNLVADGATLLSANNSTLLLWAHHGPSSGMDLHMRNSLA